MVKNAFALLFAMELSMHPVAARTAGPNAVVSPLWSHSCGWDELAIVRSDIASRQGELALGPGREGRWTTSWRTAHGEVVAPVDAVKTLPLAGMRPWRTFSWRTEQRHRPGLEPVVATGRRHAFESLMEDELLVALDFAGGLLELLSQPFLLRFQAEGRLREHVPDFLAVTRGGHWVIDVHRADRTDEDDLLRFAATQEVAIEVGWRYAVVTGWRPHVAANLDTLYSRRRSMTDPLRLIPQLLDAVQTAGGPVAFRTLAMQSGIEALARAVLIHLLWHRRLSVDLSQPLCDKSQVWPVESVKGYA
ncbi:TnsA-like heteromeric transposase endonuclease subunit [Streptomyces ossamyceticus]|uniref:TnsA-like heteromeric transposase endonuclease subunit n=1 Tax=Streptomyces ossamyceticus TaxID=249581 RepID=UPI001F0A16F6|nr:TnsA-like heteromeric transposase endonuclease subunit [Streptomyces ossamyceticus]